MPWSRGYDQTHTAAPWVISTCEQPGPFVDDHPGDSRRRLYNGIDIHTARGGPAGGDHATACARPTDDDHPHDYSRSGRHSFHDAATNDNDHIGFAIRTTGVAGVQGVTASPGRVWRGATYTPGADR